MDEKQNFEDSLELWRRNLSKKTGFQKIGTMLSMIRKLNNWKPFSLFIKWVQTNVKHSTLKIVGRKNPSDQETKPKDSDSGNTETKVLCLPYLLLYGENTQKLKDSRKKIAEEMERQFLSKEIIQNKGTGNITPEEKQDIFETARGMSVVLQLDSGIFITTI